MKHRDIQRESERVKRQGTSFVPTLQHSLIFALLDAGQKSWSSCTHLHSSCWTTGSGSCGKQRNSGQTQQTSENVTPDHLVGLGQIWLVQFLHLLNIVDKPYVNQFPSDTDNTELLGSIPITFANLFEFDNQLIFCRPNLF